MSFQKQGGAYKAGDIVRLKSGGPDMTVQERVDTALDDMDPAGSRGERYRCQWFSGRKLESGVFPVESLLRGVEGGDAGNE